MPEVPNMVARRVIFEAVDILGYRDKWVVVRRGEVK